MHLKLIRLLLNATRVTTETKHCQKWAKNSIKSPQRNQNRNIKWICGKSAYDQSKIFTPILQNFTQAVLALQVTFRKSDVGIFNFFVSFSKSHLWEPYI